MTNIAQLGGADKPLDVPGISSPHVCTAQATCVCGKTYYGVGPTLADAGRNAGERVAKCRAGLPASHRQLEQMKR